MVTRPGPAARVGVARSILHYEFDGAIAGFLEALGADVVLSPPTNRDIFLAGKRLVIDELCFPIKVFVGHVAHLAAQGVDRIVVPVVVGHENDRVFPCHPRSRLADIVLALGLCDRSRLLTPAFRFDEAGLAAGGFRQLAASLGYPAHACAGALAAIRGVAEPQGAAAAEGRKTLGLVGHPYVVRDAWANSHLVARLERLGCRVLTEADAEPIGYAPEGTGLHFDLATRTLTLARRWDRSPEVDGIVFLLPFNCGPDGDIARHLIETTAKPMLTLVLDELRSSVGLVTRLEAFVDLLEREPAVARGRSR